MFGIFLIQILELVLLGLAFQYFSLPSIYYSFAISTLIAFNCFYFLGGLSSKLHIVNEHVKWTLNGAGSLIVGFIFFFNSDIDQSIDSLLKRTKIPETVVLSAVPKSGWFVVSEKNGEPMELMILASTKTEQLDKIEIKKPRNDLLKTNELIFESDSNYVSSKTRNGFDLGRNLIHQVQAILPVQKIRNSFESKVKKVKIANGESQYISAYGFAIKFRADQGINNVSILDRQGNILHDEFELGVRDAKMIEVRQEKYALLNYSANFEDDIPWSAFALVKTISKSIPLVTSD